METELKNVEEHCLELSILNIQMFINRNKAKDTKRRYCEMIKTLSCS